MAPGHEREVEVFDLVDTLFTLMPMVVSHIDSQLADLNLTNTDLWALRSIDAPMPMKDLAHCMSFDPSYVTAVADRLEERGLIERQPHPSDRRVKNLALTAKGKKLKETLPNALWAETNIFSTLDSDESHQLLELLTKLISTPAASQQ